MLESLDQMDSVSLEMDFNGGFGLAQVYFG